MEVAAYNQREKCYDNFSNLLHSYQTVSRSDVDGSKTLEFWQTVLPIEGPKVIDSIIRFFLGIMMILDIMWYDESFLISISSIIN